MQNRKTQQPQKLNLLLGDCVERMKGLEEGSVDAIVCDPPYGLRFMGMAFDDLGVGSQQREWHRQWLTQAYRVLRPGGKLWAFNGSRTHHHLSGAMEEVGFEDLDASFWIYSSGFPKSMNIEKFLEKRERRRREELVTQALGALGITIDGFVDRGEGQTHTIKVEDEDLTFVVSGSKVVRSDYLTDCSTEQTRMWKGYGTALKPAQEPIIRGTKPLC